MADDTRTRQVADDVGEALQRGRNCLVLTHWTAHVDRLTDALRGQRKRPGDAARRNGRQSPRAALARLQPQPGGRPLLAVATCPYIGEGFDCRALDTLFLAAPIGVPWAVLFGHCQVKQRFRELDHHLPGAPVRQVRKASKYLSIRILGFPRKSPQWYSSTKLVAVIRARVDNSRSSRRCCLVSGWSIARNS
jgi:hypothetical protein